MSIRRLVAVPAFTLVALTGLGVASARVASAQTANDAVTSVRVEINNGMSTTLKLTGKTVDMQPDAYPGAFDNIRTNMRITGTAQVTKSTLVALDYDVYDYTGRKKIGHVTLTETDGRAYAEGTQGFTATGRATTN